MPFAKYKDFADCVKQEKDRKNPEAYCAAIMQRIENSTGRRGRVKMKKDQVKVKK